MKLKYPALLASVSAVVASPALAFTDMATDLGGAFDTGPYLDMLTAVLPAIIVLSMAIGAIFLLRSFSRGK